MKWHKYVLPVIVLLVLILFVLYPTLGVLLKSLTLKGQPGLGNYVAVFTQPHLFRTIWGGLLVAGGAATLSTLLGLIVALTVFKTALPLRRLFTAAAVLPMIIPGFVNSLAYISHGTSIAGAASSSCKRWASPRPPFCSSRRYWSAWIARQRTRPATWAPVSGKC